MLNSFFCWFALAPFTDNAVGIINQMERRPQAERTMKNKNLAIFQALFQVSKTLAPKWISEHSYFRKELLKVNHFFLLNYKFTKILKIPSTPCTIKISSNYTDKWFHLNGELKGKVRVQNMKQFKLKLSNTYDSTLPLNLKGTKQGEPYFRPPSCTTHLQLLHIIRVNSFFYMLSIFDNNKWFVIIWL